MQHEAAHNDLPEAGDMVTLVKRLREDTLDGCAAADEIVAMGRPAIEKAIQAAARNKAASKSTSVSRSQINLSGALCKAVGDERARAIATEHFGDDRHQHIAVFADKAKATRFMTALAEALYAPTQDHTPTTPPTRQETTMAAKLKPEITYIVKDVKTPTILHIEREPACGYLVTSKTTVKTREATADEVKKLDHKSSWCVRCVAERDKLLSPPEPEAKPEPAAKPKPKRAPRRKADAPKAEAKAEAVAA